MSFLTPPECSSIANGEAQALLCDGDGSHDEVDTQLAGMLYPGGLTVAWWSARRYGVEDFGSRRFGQVCFVGWLLRD